jgi:hypothetical protein
MRRRSTAMVSRGWHEWALLVRMPSQPPCDVHALFVRNEEVRGSTLASFVQELQVHRHGLELRNPCARHY